MTDETAVGVAELAITLSASKDKVYRMARANEIPGFRIGREWRFFTSKVLEHLNPTADPWAQSSQSRHARRRAA
ncbi:excisionase family DNA-binding protein [Microbacterium lacus]|uniref:excisionase family DNA-binding protein n=1 Tax=Microbacterium lacus TaxID=415217 RepID=UPI000C2CB545|nr:helix-turn-helix domain-containing protein [Microbacterium lacus]